jgi:two-component system chemotaxis response regulator CheB
MRSRGPIRVLVIDDSAFSRQAITRMLESSPLVRVVGSARNGEEALRKAVELDPDLITLDLEMPRMDGFTFLRIVMARHPTPVIVISGRGAEGDVFKALELGAVDFIAKPTLQATPMLASIERELIRKVHAVRELRIEKVSERLGGQGGGLPRAAGEERASAGGPAPLASGEAPGAGTPRVVAIGASTGGPAALMEIFGAFSEAPRCAFLVAQHMPEGFTASFAARLDRRTALAAREAQGGEEAAPGTVLVAPGGRHLEIETVAGRPVARVVAADESDRYAPSVDRLFESAAKAFGADLLAVVLTGMGDDGRRGVLAVKESGGRVVAESERTAVIHGMPLQAIRTGAVDEVLPLSEMAAAIRHGVRPRPEPGGGKGTR